MKYLHLVIAIFSVMFFAVDVYLSEYTFAVIMGFFAVVNFWMFHHRMKEDC